MALEDVSPTLGVYDALKLLRIGNVVGHRDYGLCVVDGFDGRLHHDEMPITLRCLGDGQQRQANYRELTSMLMPTEWHASV